MAKLYFHYASMNAGKSARLLTDAYNYQERGMRILMYKPAIDTREGKQSISSRIGLEATCTMITPDMDLYYDVHNNHFTVIARNWFLACLWMKRNSFPGKMSWICVG